MHDNNAAERTSVSDSLTANGSKPGFKAWLPLIGLTFSTFIFNTSEFIPIGLLSDIAADFHISESHAGLMITVYAWVVALASLPPSMDVMRDKPRRREDFIVSPPMWRGIIGMGVLFTALLIGLLVVMQKADVTSLTDFSWTATYGEVGVELTAYEESVFFSIFVLLQFWNMFNARAFATGHSAFHALRQCRGFGLIAVVILIGQIIIVSIGGQMFNVTPLPVADWLVIIGITSLVLWGGELKRLFARPAKACA